MRLLKAAHSVST